MRLTVLIQRRLSVASIIGLPACEVCREIVLWPIYAQRVNEHQELIDVVICEVCDRKLSERSEQ